MCAYGDKGRGDGAPITRKKPCGESLLSRNFAHIGYGSQSPGHCTPGIFGEGELGQQLLQMGPWVLVVGNH